MAYIDKLLNKFNKIQNSINSLKGISAKIQSLNYNTEIDKLGDLKAKAIKDLTDRNEALRDLNAKSGNLNKDGYLKKLPTTSRPELVYPFHDNLANYLVFDIRDRKVGNELPADTIALYIPDELISSATVSFGQGEISPIAKAITGVLDAFGDGTSAGDAAVDGTKAVVGSISNKIKNFLTGGISNIKAGIAINPQKETTLQPLEFRTFSFNYEFNPRSEEEATQVRKIIHTFRMAMLPDGLTAEELDDGRQVAEEQGIDTTETGGRERNELFFSFPNVFDVYFDGPVGTKIDGFLPAVCTSAEVNYSGGQKFATHYDGQPVKINLSLSFQEIRVMTRRNYKEISSFLHDGEGANIIDNTNDSIVDANNPRRPVPVSTEVEKKIKRVVPGQGGGAR